MLFECQRVKERKTAIAGIVSAVIMRFDPVQETIQALAGGWSGRSHGSKNRRTTDYGLRTFLKSEIVNRIRLTPIFQLPSPTIAEN